MHFTQKFKTKRLITFTAVIMSFLTILLSSSAYAVPAVDTGSPPPDPTKAPAECKSKDPNAAQLKSCLQKNPIIKDINAIVAFLSAGAGIIVVGSIIVGGIQYIMAGNNPNSVSAAKERITNALIALLIFLFAFAFLQWIIPGGLLFS